MSGSSEVRRPEMSAKELKDLREELWIVGPFFAFVLSIFLGSFQYRFEARTVPMIIGFAATILTGMRLFHILFPKSRVGEFKEAGLAGEFDDLKAVIEEENLKGMRAEEPATEITFAEEKKAFIAVLGSLVSFLLMGYLVGIFFVIVGISYYYGYREKTQIFISVVAMYVLCYAVLYKLLGAPADFGLLLEPILHYLDVL